MEYVQFHRVSDMNIGIECIDGDIWISNNYWMEIEDDYISSSICPSNYCCSKESDCHYIDDEDDLCALNRDHAAPLCGRCKEGYSERIKMKQCIGNCYYFRSLFPMLTERSPNSGDHFVCDSFSVAPI